MTPNPRVIYALLFEAVSATLIEFGTKSVLKTHQHRQPWNKGKLIGQKPPLKPKDIWAIRIQLQNARQVRDLAMFNIAIDSKGPSVNHCFIE